MEQVDTEVIDDEVKDQVDEQVIDELDTGTDTDDGVVVSIGEESPTSEEAEEQRAPEWVRELRKSNREQAREIRDLKAQAVTAAKPLAIAGKLRVRQRPLRNGTDAMA